jgi:outer membrane lipoprotein carrier protein
MRKIICILIAFVGLINLASAQNDPKAQEILDAMSKKYKDMPSFKAKFTYTLENDNHNLKESSEGEIIVKGGKFHLNLAGQEIINNGTTVWTYLKQSNEVNIANYEPDEDEINPTQIYTLYKKGYKYILLSEQNEGGKIYSVVDLEPIDKKSQFYKIRIMINKKDKTVKSWKMFEKSGNKYVYTVKNFVPNYKVEDNFFTFDMNQHKGVTPNDLR